MHGEILIFGHANQILVLLRFHLQVGTPIDLLGHAIDIKHRINRGSIIIVNRTVLIDEPFQVSQNVSNELPMWLMLRIPSSVIQVNVLIAMHLPAHIEYPFPLLIAVTTFKFGHLKSNSNGGKPHGTLKWAHRCTMNLMSCSIPLSHTS
jgi:hypothetical protein